MSRNFDTVNNAAAKTNFSIALVDKDDNLSDSVLLSSLEPVANRDLTGPVGSEIVNITPTVLNLHPILQTYRIRLTDFKFKDGLKNLRGIRFTFDQTVKGAIFLANIRFNNSLGVSVPPPEYVQFQPDEFPEEGSPAAPATPPLNANPCLVGRAVDAGPLPVLGGVSGFTIGVFSPIGFSNRDAAPVMTVVDNNTGSLQPFQVSFYPNADTNTLVFALTFAEYKTLPYNFPYDNNYSVTIQYGIGSPSEIWECTPLRIP